MTERLCPVCGSSDIKDEKVDVILEEPFGGTATVETHEIVCSVCGSRGDFFNENEEILEDTYKLLKQRSIENILHDFANHKISMSGIERALGIPQRTLTKWKNGNASPSATGIALMRFVRLFPWMLHVAETKYDYNEAQKIHIKEAVKQLLSVVPFYAEDIFKSDIIATTDHDAFISIIHLSGREAGRYQPAIDITPEVKLDY